MPELEQLAKAAPAQKITPLYESCRKAQLELDEQNTQLANLSVKKQQLVEQLEVAENHNVTAKKIMKLNSTSINNSKNSLTKRSFRSIKR
ncbi:hypothetical protein [Psychrosphaera algicola]|uniref:Uncharacterized protein n=1 Tax=Psychrosphaera algicola TaxID=3023714 RepID=A0ABT5FCJ5_9GAMM|nr:hypothetical protein [Psychrosphaera sp. G1-22]MDC2888568.1 hypothetical protein [Psychrosphaera sp. G1-22]